jgi:hypothetical protein
MSKEILYPPLVHWRSLLKGMTGGSLLVGGIVTGYGLLVQALLFIMGLAILVDSVMVTGKGVFIVISLLSALVFGVITLILSITQLIAAYLVIIFIIALLLYSGIILSSWKKVSRRKEPAARRLLLTNSNTCRSPSAPCPSATRACSRGVVLSADPSCR